MGPISLGLEVTFWSVFHRWESSAKPLSPRHLTRAEQHIPGAGVNVQFLHALRFLHRGEDAVTCAFVPAVGQARHPVRVIPQHRQDILPGRGQVMDIPRQHIRDPHRQATGVEQALDVPQGSGKVGS